MSIPYICHIMKKPVFLLLFLLAAVSCSMPVDTPENASQTLESIIMSRRSIRRYTACPISRDTLDIILNSGLNAPNGQNRQAYEIRVVGNPEFLAEISAAVQTGDSHAVDAAGSATSAESIFHGAPCVLFLANDTSYDMSQVDCGLLGENMILTAWSMGIGSCCMAGPVRQMKDSEACAPLIGKMGFSEGYNLLYCIVMGYPDESPSARPRKTEKIRYVE